MINFVRTGIKKSSAVLLALFFLSCVSLTACGSNNDETPPDRKLTWDNKNWDENNWN